MSDSHQDYFSKLYVANEQPLYGFIYSLLHNRTDADDVIQETMAQLWERFEDYDRSRPFFPWACRFAYRKVLMHRRRESVRRTYLSEEVLESLAQDYPQDSEWEKSRRLALKMCLSKLSSKQANLLQARYEADDSMVKIAERLGQSVNALYKSLQRIRSKLVDCVEQRLSSGVIE